MVRTIEMAGALVVAAKLRAMTVNGERMTTPAKALESDQTAELS